MGSVDHCHERIESVACAIITVSDTRTPETDTSGALIREGLESAGHRVLRCDVVPDDPARVGDRVMTLCKDGACQAVLLSGGTGLAPRDSTYEAVATLLDKRLDGFGELFRMLSFAEVGPAAMLSRAVGGVRGSTLIFSMPGSTAAVRLAMDKLILPQLGHLAWVVRLPTAEM